MTLEARLRSGRGEVLDDRDSDRLLVLFGSRLGGIVAGVPPWAFADSSRGTTAARLFLRDPAQAWYQRGTPEHPSVSALAGYVGDVAARFARVRLFGASMGGYGALHLARLLGLDAYTVNPQTFIDGRMRRAVGDDRWQAELDAIEADLPTDACVDLGRLPYRGGRHVIVYARQSPLDVIHAQTLTVAGVVLDGRDSADHALARHLAASGELQAELLA